MVEADKDLQKNQDSSQSIEEDQDLAKNDADLLAYQKQRSAPRISLSSVGIHGDGEKLELEVDNFGQIDGDNSKLGMAAAGTEEKIIMQLHKQGSFDAGKLKEVGQSPLLKAGGPLEDEDFKEYLDDKKDEK